MRIIDLFSGVGGLSLGFKNAGFDVLLAIEKDKSIAKAFQKNHHNTDLITDDITSINFTHLDEKYKNIDVIVGGPPCQGFSQKGKRNIFDDERNFLFEHFLKAVQIFKPKYFLMENVPNILTSGDGFFKKQILQYFYNSGYETNEKILNSAKFGVPQKRKRAFIVGQLGAIDFELPEGNNRSTDIKEAIYDLPFIKSGEGNEFYEYEKLPDSKYQKIMRENSDGIYDHIATNHSEIALKRLSLIPKGKGKESLPDHHKTKSIYSGTWTRLKENGKASTITTRFDTPSSGKFIHPTLNRCITIREAARIQSFPDRFRFYGTKSSKMKQVGNAVPPILAEVIATAIKKSIQK